MKKLHIHITVPDLADSIHYYSSLFGCEPGKEKSDYARWDLVEPSVNFAISTGGKNFGLDHLGIQVEDESEVRDIKHRLEQASLPAGKIESGVCCYAESTKSWSVDKAGIPWENFVTTKDAEVYGADLSGDSCCADNSRVEQNNCC